MTDVFSHGLVFTSLVLSDGIFGILEDSDTVNHEIVTNVVDERPWVGVDSSHLSEFLEISNDSFAVSESGFDFDNTRCDFLKSSKDIRSGLFLDILDTFLNIRKDNFRILDACLNTIESFGFEGTDEDTRDDFGDLFDLNGDFLGGEFLLSGDFVGTDEDFVNDDTVVGSVGLEFTGSVLSLGIRQFHGNANSVPGKVGLNVGVESIH